ncbi:hypothetical protein C3L33_06185, partial [Rhododendron williamsianum]
MLTFLCLLIILVAPPVTPVSSQDKNIFLLAGQSNMVGEGGVINGTWDGVVPPESGPNPSVLRLAANLTWVPAASRSTRTSAGTRPSLGWGPGCCLLTRCWLVTRASAWWDWCLVRTAGPR